MENRIVIIGGGLSGLYCAALLAKKGKKATILEQHLTVGGLAAGFTRKGYYFDSSISRFISDNSAGYFKALGIYEKLDFRPLTAAVNVEGKTFSPRNVQEYFAMCHELFPDERDGLMRFYHDCIEDVSRFMETSTRTAAMSYSGSRQAVQLVKMMSDILRTGCLRGMSQMQKAIDIDLEDTLATYIDRESRLFAMLTGGKHFDIFQKNGRKNLMTFVGALCAVYSLNKAPLKGFQQVCDEIADIARSNGAEIITGAKVKRILVVDDRATGVEYIKSGQTISLSADIVIHAADLKKAYQDLIPGECSSESVLHKIRASEITHPIPIMYIGLKVNPQRVKDCFAGMNELVYYPKLIPDSEPFDASDYYKYAQLTFHSSCFNNPDHAPRGCTGIQVYLTSAPVGWQNHWGIVDGKRTDQYLAVKRMVIDDVLSNLEKIIPEVSDRSLIDVCELGTPFTIERYTGNTGGSHCGFTWDRRKNLVNAGLGKFHDRHETIGNLYFISHWTGYLGGVTNAFWSAKRMAAKL